jgi:hypothetical protein
MERDVVVILNDRDGAMERADQDDYSDNNSAYLLYTSCSVAYFVAIGFMKINDNYFDHISAYLECMGSCILCYPQIIHDGKKNDHI